MKYLQAQCFLKGRSQLCLVWSRGCSVSPIIFSVFIDDLLRELEKADLGIPWGGGGGGG